jgi:hypothetical protein
MCLGGSRERELAVDGRSLTSAEGAADVAVEEDVFALGLVEEIAAVGAEDEGSDGCHGGSEPVEDAMEFYVRQ